MVVELEEKFDNCETNISWIFKLFTFHLWLDRVVTNVMLDLLHMKLNFRL